MLMFPLKSTVLHRDLGRQVAGLFSAGEPGAWYDPSDMSTLFQDAAGTTPVTAVEQPVGRILDKSGRGNHATQATTTKRPVLSRRVNLHRFSTENFSNAGKFKSGTGLEPVVTPNYATAPDGSMSAIRVQLDSGGGTTGSDYSILSDGFAAVAQQAGVAYTTKVWLRATGSSANVAIVGAGAVYVTVTLDSTWRLIELNETGAANGTFTLRLASSGGLPVRGSQDFLIWHPSLTLATDAHLPYQWVNTDTDYDADPAKFPAYLRFDGVDDALQTGNIDFTSTDKMTVWAEVTKLSDAAAGVVAEFGVFSNTTLYGSASVQTVAAGGYLYGSRGTLGATASAATGYVAPTSNVICGVGDISGDIATLRINNAQAAHSTADQGTGNYGNYPLYIGARAGTSIFFNGRLYSLIVRGAQTPLSQIEATEAYIKQKMRLP